MGRIKNTDRYALKNNPVVGDFVIGSDSENNGKTVNFPVEAFGGDNPIQINQDNKFKLVSIGAINLPDNTNATPLIVDAINNRPIFEIKEDEIPYISGTLVLDKGKTRSIVYSFINTGKGTYGDGGDIVIRPLDLVQIRIAPFVQAPDVDRLNVDIVDLGELGTNNVTDLINTLSPPTEVIGSTNKYFECTDGGSRVLYGFRGANGIYGLNNNQVTISNLFLVFEEQDSGIAAINEGNNITITGTGSSSDPLVINADPAGDVFKVGTPSSKQIPVWTGDGTIEGSNSFVLDKFIGITRQDIGLPNSDGAGLLRLNGHPSTGANAGISLFTNKNDDADTAKWDINAFDGGATGSFRIKSDGSNTLTIKDDTLAIVGTSNTIAVIDAETDDKVLITKEWYNAQSSGGTSPTGLELVGSGWRLVGANPSNYGSTQFGSMDLSTSDQGTGVNGATGALSFAVGYNSISSGQASVAMGFSNTASGSHTTSIGRFNTSISQGSIAIGESNTATNGYTMGIGNTADLGGVAIGNTNISSGDGAVAIGTLCKARSQGEICVGRYPTDYTPNSTTGYNVNDRAFNVGAGINGNTLIDVLTIYKSGEVTAPALSTSIIDSEVTGKVLVTKEWFNANAGENLPSVTVTNLNSTNTSSGSFSVRVKNGVVIVKGNFTASQTGSLPIGTIPANYFPDGDRRAVLFTNNSSDLSTLTIDSLDGTIFARVVNGTTYDLDMEITKTLN